MRLLQCNPVRESTTSRRVSLTPGLSLVILRQIIQDCDLMGSVKSDGNHRGPPSERNKQLKPRRIAEIKRLTRTGHPNEIFETNYLFTTD